jgi:zinc transport system ATP-binding protein
MSENTVHPCNHPLHQLKVEHLSVVRDGQSILHDISLTLHCGEIVALIGPNGGGKSTLLKAIVGELPSTGRVIFNDDHGRGMVQPRIGYLMQQLEYDRQAPLTVADFLCANQSRWPVFLGPRRKRRAAVVQLLEHVEAAHLIDKPLGGLSGGELQRVLLAFALDPRPDILLLDEPVSALDKDGKQLFYELVRHLRDRYDLLTLIVSHDLDVISTFADSVIYLDRTIQAAGPMQDVLASGQFLDAFEPVRTEGGRPRA